MDTQTASNIIVAVTAVASLTVGALVTYFVEGRRQKGELERLKLSWKREERYANLEPIRKWLDEISYEIWDYDSKLFDLNFEPEHAQGDESKQAKITEIAELQRHFMTTLSDFMTKSAPAFSRAGDEDLQGLVTNEIIVPLSRGGWSEKKPEIQSAITRAYRRIEELATEF